MLVLPQEEKNILSASVLKSTASDELEIISGRRPGVVILFRGGPGTGKTFAAEALAELSRRPLYRLTSSDIGIELKEVERNLNEAFYLGGIWDASRCRSRNFKRDAKLIINSYLVMLIDDCNVYLERRSESDFSRNAVVSFVLQALDYHQGIIILTSKGQLQKAEERQPGAKLLTGLRLEPALVPRVHITCEFELDDNKRKEVWRSTMKAFNLHINEDGGLYTTDDILKSILKQDSSTLSIREIRNAIQTATNLATKDGRRANASDIGMAINMIRRNRRLPILDPLLVRETQNLYT